MNIRSLQLVPQRSCRSSWGQSCWRSCGFVRRRWCRATFIREIHAAIVAVAGQDSFLLYPNPQSSPAIDSQTYAQAYYAAIDPTNAKDTLARWKAANGFGNLATGSEVQAVFGDVRDLGYGRYVTARKNADGTVAFYVDNYLVWTAAGYGYSDMNRDAAVARDP